jgi:glycosyltransferase involved in cell wall biosynthesis
MSCGAPVICSNTSSLAEIVNDAGVLLDLGDLRGWIEAMELILSDQELQAELGEQGLKRAKLFSWERTARQICEVCEELSPEQSATSCQGPASRG